MRNAIRTRQELNRYLIMDRLVMFFAAFVAGFAFCFPSLAQDSGTQPFILRADVSFLDQLNSNGAALKGLEAFKEELRTVNTVHHKLEQIDALSVQVYPNPFIDVIHLAVELTEPQRLETSKQYNSPYQWI